MFALPSIAVSFAALAASTSTIAPILSNAKIPLSRSVLTLVSVSVSVLLILSFAVCAARVTIALKSATSVEESTFCLLSITLFCFSSSVVIAFIAPLLSTVGASVALLRLLKNEPRNPGL